MTWKELINELKRIPEERLDDEAEIFVHNQPLITVNSLTRNSKSWYGFQDEDGDYIICNKEDMINIYEYDENQLEDYLIIKPGGFTLDQ